MQLLITHNITKRRAAGRACLMLMLLLLLLLLQLIEFFSGCWRRKPALDAGQIYCPMFVTVNLLCWRRFADCIDSERIFRFCRTAGPIISGLELKVCSISSELNNLQIQMSVAQL